MRHLVTVSTRGRARRKQIATRSARKAPESSRAVTLSACQQKQLSGGRRVGDGLPAEGSGEPKYHFDDDVKESNKAEAEAEKPEPDAKEKQEAGGGREKGNKRGGGGRGEGGLGSCGEARDVDHASQNAKMKAGPPATKKVKV